MSNFKLNFPTDIPWKRICVTEDMVDRIVCDANLPPKWNSSLAVFKYTPEDEFQSYPDYKITYLKVTATITGYQPLDAEIQGKIDWDGLNVGTREGITELLTSYYPCNGAILQVVVGPKGKNPKIEKKNYPFFMDFEPKKRELCSFTTHISQMYNQLNSYHIGTNRAVFSVQPRPHVLEEPSGFVRGPRPVEGIQEFFLVVAQPKNQEDFCVSLKLDTAHLTTIQVMDYEKRAVSSDTALAIANLPTPLDRVETREVRCVVDRPGNLLDNDIFYKKFVKKANDNVVYQAPSGFRIESWSDEVNNRINGFSTVQESADGKTLTVNAEARSSVWRQDEKDGWFVDCPDLLDKTTGRVERRVRINLTSTSRTKKVGERDVLLITTRGLCCCPESGEFKPGVLVTGTKIIPDYYGGTLQYDTPTYGHENFPADTRFESIGNRKENLKSDKNDCRCKEQLTKPTSPLDKRMSIRKANEMIGFIKDEILKSMVNPLPENTPKPFIQTDFFVKKLQAYQSSVGNGKATLNRKIGKDLPKAVCKKLESRFGKKMNEITVYDVMTLKNYELGKLGKMKPDEVARFKLSQLGIKFKPVRKPRKRRKK